MASFGYQPGDGTGVDVLMGFSSDMLFTHYVNDTGGWVWVSSIELFNVKADLTGTYQVKLFYDTPGFPGLNPHYPGPVSDVLTNLFIAGGNTFTLTEEAPIPPDAVVWIGFKWQTTFPTGVPGWMRMDGAFRTDYGRSRNGNIGGGGSGNFPTNQFGYFVLNNAILPMTLSGDNTTDPTLTNMEVPLDVIESTVDGYSNIRVTGVLQEPLSEGYDNLRVPLHCSESLHPIAPEPFMSTEVFPSLIGLSFNVVKKPTFNTRVVRGINGNEVRNAFMQWPIWEFELTYDYLPDRSLGTTDLKTLMGFYLARQGRFDTFLFKDPDDYVTTGSPMTGGAVVGEGDGVTTQFLFSRSMGGFVEPIGQVDTAEDYFVYVDAVLQVEGVDYDITMPNRVVFTSAPADGALITNSLQYYFICRFLEDSQEYEKFMDKLWELQTCSFTSVLQ